MTRGEDKMPTTREIWTEAVRRLTERYMAAHPGVSRTTAYNIVSSRHEEIGAVMDAMEGKR